MSDPQPSKTYPLHEALRAQKALRDMAGLGDEKFPVEAFVGMISDEIEALRKRGLSDQAIAEAVRKHSSIQLDAEDIQRNYAPPAQRQHGSE